MAQRPAYFVVSLVLGREVPALYWDELPPRNPIRNLIYVLRLDTLPNGEKLVGEPLWRLYSVFCHLRKAGKLPPRWQPPPRPPAEDAKILVGHRENVRRGSDTPYDPHA